MVMPKTSAVYVAALKDRAASDQVAKRAKFEAIKRANAGNDAAIMNKVGAGFVGPVQMRLKYEGIVRNVLDEDPIAPGAVPVYDILDEMGRAYFIENYQGEAKISQFEGKRLMYGFHHIAAYPTVQEQDMLELTVDSFEYAVEESRQRIMETEDTFLLAEMDHAIAAVNAANPDFSGQDTHVVESINAEGIFMPNDFYTCDAAASRNRLEAKNILMNPADAFDVLRWDLNTSSVKFRDKLFDGTPVVSFADYQIFKSVMIAPGSAYMMADSKYVGKMPVRKSLEIRNDDKAPRFTLGAVMDEYVNIILLNSGSLYRIDKKDPNKA